MRTEDVDHPHIRIIYSRYGPVKELDLSGIDLNQEALKMLRKNENGFV